MGLFDTSQSTYDTHWKSVIEQWNQVTAYHDGKLGGEYEVCLGTITIYPSGKREHGEGITISDYDEMMCLDPKQALSLLAWLEQEKETLEKLAAEDT